MSSINSGYDFIFANEESKEHGVFLCSAFGSTTRSKNVENRTLITSKNVLGEVFNFHGVRYDSPLSFDIIIAQTDGSYIDAYKERELKKWLCKNSRQWFHVNQIDLADTMYYCIASSVEVLDVGMYSGCLLVKYECDTYHAWSGLKTITKTSSGTLSFKYNNSTDFDEYIVYPSLIIQPLVNGTISVSNTSTGETITIQNCATSEIINLDCKVDKIKSSTRQIIDSWNKNTMSLKEGTNDITLTGTFKMTMQYRVPIRVGA